MKLIHPRRTMIVTAVAIMCVTIAPSAASALTLSPAGDSFKATATNVNVYTPLEPEYPFATCTFTATGRVPSSGAVLSAVTPTMTSCTTKTAYKPVTVTTRGTWQFTLQSTTALSVTSGGGIDMEMLEGRCTVRSRGAGKPSSDTWTNGSESPLVESQSTMFIKNLPVAFKGPCPALGEQGLNMAASAGHPLVWTDTTNPKKTILVK